MDKMVPGLSRAKERTKNLSIVFWTLHKIIAIGKFTNWYNLLILERLWERYMLFKKIKLCIKGIHFSSLKREITNVKRMISELKSKMCEWYITEWIRDCMMDVHSSNIIRHIINDVCSQNHINVWRYQKGNMKSKKYRDPAHVCAQVRKWIFSVFCRILSWEVDLLPLIALLVILLWFLVF